MLGGHNYHPLSEYRAFSGTEPPLDLRPFCKLKFVRCGPGEKNQSALPFLVEAWRPDEVREHLFSNSKIDIFDKIREFSKNSQGTSLKARGLIFLIVALYIRI